MSDTSSHTTVVDVVADAPAQPRADAPAEPRAESLVEQDLLVEDVSIDGMCGVY